MGPLFRNRDRNQSNHPYYVRNCIWKSIAIAISINNLAFPEKYGEWFGSYSVDASGHPFSPPHPPQARCLVIETGLFYTRSIPSISQDAEAAFVNQSATQKNISSALHAGHMTKQGEPFKPLSGRFWSCPFWGETGGRQGF